MPAPGSISDRRPLVPGGQENGDSGAAFWPRIVRAADGSALIGVLVSRSTAFSGGGARASRLDLVRAAADQCLPPQSVLVSFPTLI